MPINFQTAEVAYETVLDNAGAILPTRDAIDTRVIKEVRGGYATYEGENYKKENKVADPSKASGIIDSQSDVGSWPVLKSASAPKDTDHDGMLDEWEKKNGLNPNYADDRNTVANDGYTMLEKSINNIN